MVKMRIEDVEFTKPLYLGLDVQSRVKKLTLISFLICFILCMVV